MKWFYLTVYNIIIIIIIVCDQSAWWIHISFYASPASSSTLRLHKFPAHTSMDQVEERSIEEVQKYVQLYDSLSPRYKDRQMATNSWRDISKHIGVGRVTAQQHGRVEHKYKCF